MSKPISVSNKKYKQGLFKPQNPDKYIGDPEKINYKSSWEKKFMIFADTNPDIVQWASEPFAIPYFSKADNKQRRYYIDFVFKAKTQTGIETFLVEIKPDAQTKPPKNPKRITPGYIKECYDFQVNQDKWEAAKVFATKNGAKFVILTEKSLGLKR